MQTAILGPAQRAEALARMAERELDVLVVGGGVVGAGTALDAATRGLATGLVEARDWASGTSSRSSKLIHGGLRYLEMLDFALVREALKERGLLLERLAPHLVKPVPFLYPLQHKGWERWYAGAGVALYDAMSVSSGHGRGLPVHRHLSQKRALRVAPCLKKGALVGALQYYDAQMDDARYVATMVRTAASYGAAVANRARVVGFLREGERVVGARVEDVEGGGEYEIRARQIVNASGVWTDDTQALIGERGQFHVRASKGIHLVVPKDRIHSSSGLILRTEKSVLFVIPWGRHWIVGTTDTDWDLDKAHPAASSADIDYLLEHVNEVLATPLTRDDVEGVYAGLRPLLAGESDATSKLSREHTVAHPVPGLVVVAGGKYTTYRVMAKDAVDEAVHGLDQRVAECVTEDVPLVGAEGYRALWNARARIAARTGLHVARIEHLLNRYGSLAEELLELVVADPSLGEPLTAADDYLRAEAVYACTHEGARHLDDVLTRRTRISIETFDRGVRSAREVAELIAPALGWDDDQVEKEIAHYHKRVEAERESQRQPDDLTADAARLGAPDIVPL
ncbi:MULTISPECIES: glycerol-3-phosphate dehydrogenase/oxidase [Streptomyces]|uniref:glycerol-3-phosphate dehydrogenase/oxidase n=1 Tax=Streptomyces TaxID=1883 RepID=UPI00089B15A3|nr:MULTISPECIES: glycerol-3-phosphate dehydrogenase/oxidase [Streptomyces]MCF3176618.1 glycerol-3-phosphate dehydrogenase/oxidase [Streptomyces sioyaensis]PJJ02640.1 glycerol-3-phosphate dehydrogenase [Streptomyces sp. 2333.5]TXC94468.1 glycerol-3-phosphate dehydrogenase/oxidase [Streptomyces sp. ISID311]SED19215.1 glycerol-3-phosphate dehydrogenase [Streptomyces sp. 2314.4]SEE07398.1 glycerol-3-phosphate dehydrogenase [Streptomyces sp. 2112.2]